MSKIDPSETDCTSYHKNAIFQIVKGPKAILGQKRIFLRFLKWRQAIGSNHSQLLEFSINSWDFENFGPFFMIFNFFGCYCVFLTKKKNQREEEKERKGKRKNLKKKEESFD